jgi:hypothetical protein
MPDKFDAYREALVMETTTVWPPELDSIAPSEKQRIAAALHAEPEHTGHLEYIRGHTGFCRQITVTQEDLDRLNG